MFINRCPYCGEELSAFESFFMKIGKVWPVKCPYCDNKYAVHVPRNFMQVVPILFYFIFLRDGLAALDNEFLNFL